jgi:hypothetical protein
MKNLKSDVSILAKDAGLCQFPAAPPPEGDITMSRTGNLIGNEKSGTDFWRLTFPLMSEPFAQTLFDGK